MTALRELLARFTVEVDAEGNLPKGNRQVDALRDKLKGVDAVAGGLSGRLRASFGALPGRVGALADGIGGRLRGAFDGASASLNAPGKGLVGGLLNMRTALLATGATFAARAVWGFVDSTITAAASVNDMAQRLGVTTDEFQELQGVAQLGGTEVGAVATAFSTLSRNAIAFAKGDGGEAAEAFTKLGLQVKDANGNVRPAIDLFYEAGDALAGLDNATERQAYAQRLLGRSARELLPVFNDLAGMTAEQRAEVRALSIVYGEDFIQASADADDKMLLAGKVFEALKARVIGFTIEGIIWATEKLTEFGKWLGEVTKGMSLGTLAFAAGAVAVSLYATKLNTAITAGGGWTRVLGGMARGAGGVVKTMAPLIAQFLLLEDLLVFFAGGRSVTGRLLDSAFGEGTGKGVQKTIKELIVVFQDLWKWVLGDGAGEKAKALFAEIGEGLRLMVNDALALIPGSGRTAGIEGLRAFEARQSAPVTASGAASDQVARGAIGLLAAPLGPLGALVGGAIAGGPGIPASAGERQGVTVINDQSTRNVTMNMQPGASPQQNADAVSKRLEADRASVAARVP